MNSITIFAVIALSGACLVSGSIEFDSYTKLFNKNYKTSLEKSLRNEVFNKNKQFIEKFNSEQADKLGFKLGFSHLTDLTPREFALRKGFKLAAENSMLENSPKAVQFYNNLFANVSARDIPVEVDWTKVDGVVSEVKDQGNCGSCWAFSATGALEGQMKKRSGSLISLSEQNLIDCSKTDHGCDGGVMAYAWQDINKEGGIESEESYPYQAEQGVCQFKKSKSVFDDSSFYILNQGDEEQLLQTVAQFGPVSVGINSSPRTFHYYQHGVYEDVECTGGNEDLDHGVLVVGYGTDAETGKDYWLVKNSWGQNWGENGYVKMARNVNMCGIATAAMIPTF